MSTSNAWAEFAGVFMRTREAHLEHEKAKAELKSLMPEDAQQSIWPWHSGETIEVGRH
jgi:hypothetical protein